MSLLSEEQVSELASVLDKCGCWESYELLIKNWNAQQKPVDQTEPDWNEAPKNAAYWSLKEVWTDKNANQLDWGFIKQRERPITAHPNAAVMLKYAQVAARRADPWNEFEFRSMEGQPWEKPTLNLCFYTDWQYRYIGEDNQ